MYSAFKLVAIGIVKQLLSCQTVQIVKRFSLSWSYWIIAAV